jgi:hypothetical protein
VVFDGIPDNRLIDTLIFVSQDVADPGNVLPADVLVRGLDFPRYMPAGLGDDLDAPFDGGPQQP